MISLLVSLERKMSRWSSQSYAVGLLLLFSLNGVIPGYLDPEDYTEEQESIYCLLGNCPADTQKPHFGCNNKGTWPKACGPDPQILPITDIIQKYLVDRHNTFRDTVASGKTHKLPAAGRMLKLAWSSDLADLAKVLIKRCEPKPTKSCISTLKYSAPGFNTVYNQYTKGQSAFNILRSQLDAWYDQYTQIESLDGPLATESKAGHFLRMMVGPSNYVGCAMALTENGGLHYQWLTCLYSCSAKNNSVPYVDSTKPGSLCNDGIDEKFKHLCAEEEFVNSCEDTPLEEKGGDAV